MNANRSHRATRTAYACPQTAPRPYPFDGDERWKYYQHTGLDPKTYWGEITPGLTHSEVHTAPPSYVRWSSSRC